MLVSSIGSFNFPVLTGDTLRHLASVEYFFLTHHSFCHLPKKCFYFGQEHLELAFIIGVSHGSPDKSKHVILICIDCQPLEYLTLVLCFFKLKDVMEDGKIFNLNMKVATQFEDSFPISCVISLCVKSSRLY